MRVSAYMNVLLNICVNDAQLFLTVHGGFFSQVSTGCIPKCRLQLVVLSTFVSIFWVELFSVFKIIFAGGAGSTLDRTGPSCACRGRFALQRTDKRHPEPGTLLQDTPLLSPPAQHLPLLTTSPSHALPMLATCSY